MRRFVAVAACLGIVSAAGVADAATWSTSGTNAPTVDGKDIAFLGSAPSLDKWFPENSGAGDNRGQTFTPTNDVLVNAFTLRTGLTSQKAPTTVYRIRLGVVDPVASKFYELYHEEATQTNLWSTNSYATWTLDTPQPCHSNVVYGVDVGMRSSTSGWQQGIPYVQYGPDAVGGTTSARYNSPRQTSPTYVAGVGTDVALLTETLDRIFHLDLSATTITDVTAPNLTSIEDGAGGGPIFDDYVVLGYTLTFDEAIDTNTIDLADFENAGSGVSLTSLAVTSLNAPFPVPSVVTMDVGLSGTGTLQLQLKSGATITDIAGNPIVSPFTDDTTITVTAGTTPSPTVWWDGPTAGGVGNGMSDGGSGIWDQSNVYWDRGLGLSGARAWANANGDSAVFGGSGGTVTIGEAITVSNMTLNSVNYTFDGSSPLNFLTGGKIDSTLSAAGTQRFSGPITGSPEVRINKYTDAKKTYFSPPAGVTQTLGRIVHPYNSGIGTGDKGLLVLEGSSTNTVESIGWEAHHYGYMEVNGTGKWTVNGDVHQGRLQIKGGTLIINGNFWSRYAWIETIQSGARLGGNLTIGGEPNYMLSASMDVNGGGILSPGDGGVGRITCDWGSSGSARSWNFKDGSIYEWDVGATSNDTIASIGSSVNVGVETLNLDNFVLKIRDAGGTPAATDQLLVFSYNSDVTVDMSGFGNTAANFDTSELGGDWTVGTLSLTDDTTGGIYLTGLSKGGAAGTPGTMIYLK